MAAHKQLDRLSRNIRARLSKPRPVRIKKSVKANPYAIMRDLRRVSRIYAHRHADNSTALFLYGIVLGHAHGIGEITEQELDRLTRNPE